MCFFVGVQNTFMGKLFLTHITRQSFLRMYGLDVTFKGVFVPKGFVAQVTFVIVCVSQSVILEGCLVGERVGTDLANEERFLHLHHPMTWLHLNKFCQSILKKEIGSVTYKKGAV